jgi:VWFA-related protein
MYSKALLVIFGLMILVGFSVSPAQATTRNSSRPADDDILIDLPNGGQVRVQNQFGNVSADVWNNPFVSVSATIEGTGSVRFRRSPIVIDNRGSVLSISVVRTPVDPVALIHLQVKVPANSNVQIVTTSGRIVTRGLSTTATLKSASGDIQSVFRDPVSANITARAARGTIRSTLSAQPAPDGHSFQARLGDGDRSLSAETESGGIELLFEDSRSTKASQPELLGPTSGSAVGTPASSDQGDLTEGDVIRVDSQLVTLNMSVIDRSTNRGVLGLQQPDFRLYEDGAEQRIVQFDSSSAPFDLILLIDLSGSTREVVKLIRAAALRFIDAARPADRISVITFAGEPTLVSELTIDRQLLRERVSAIDTARGDTKLYDATDFAMKAVVKDPKKSRRTAIVLMSDGLDGTIPGVSGQTGSQLPYDELLRNVQEFDGVLYTLWLNTRYVALNPRDTQPEAFDEGYDRMKEMADMGGGIFYEVKSLQDLAGAYEQVVADLGTVYSLAYRPSNNARDGKWRAIRINVNRSNAVARGKRGYYAN